MSPKSKLGVIQRLPLTRARVNLGAVVRRVRVNKEYVILEKDGIPVVALMDIDEFEDYLELRTPKVRQHIQKSNDQYLAGNSRPAEEFLAERRSEARRKTKRRRRA